VTGRLALADPLPLADRVRKASRASTCTICHAPVTIGQPIAHLATPRGWCHVKCAPAVAAIIITTTGRIADRADA
jgi:hypothetical protein